VVDSDRQIRNLKKLTNTVKHEKEQRSEIASEFFTGIPFTTIEDLPKLKRLETDVRFNTRRYPVV
jgi:hypothetical protein